MEVSSGKGKRRVVDGFSSRSRLQARGNSVSINRCINKLGLARYHTRQRWLCDATVLVKF